MTSMTRIRFLQLFFLLLLGLLAIACMPTRPTPQPSATAAPAQTPQPSPSAVLSACDPGTQSLAMLPDQLPDWRVLAPETCYQLALTLDPAQAAYQGSAKVVFSNQTGGEIRALVFRTYPNSKLVFGGDLFVDRARVRGERVDPEVFLEDKTGLRLPLEPALPPGESVMVELEFSGQAPVDFGDLPDVYGIYNFAGQEQVLTLANWYPILAIYDGGEWQAEPVTGIGDAVVSQVGLYEVEITAPSNWHVVTTGSLIDESVAGDRTRRTFASGPVRDFFVQLSPSFVMQQGEVGGVTVRHWGLPGGERRWDEALQATLDSLALFSERFGPYPYSELDVSAVPLKNGSGVEYPGVFLVGDTLYQADAQPPFLLGIVVSHEVAHQWWYGVVGNDVLAQPWQDEALTTYSSLLYQEVHQPRFYDDTVQFYEDRVAATESQYGERAVAQPVEDFRSQRALYGPVVYLKGALFFRHIQNQIGQQKFFEALRAYYQTNRYQLVQPEALLSAFEASCNCDLNTVYQEWGVR